MAIKSICAAITDRLGDSAALAAAAAIARREDAHLDIFCIGIDPVRYADIPTGSILMIDSAQESAKAQANVLMEWVKETLPQDLVRVSVQSVVVSQFGLDLSVSNLIRYADLVVVSRPYGDSHTASQVAVLDAALFGTSAPVMIVPDTPVDFSAPAKRVLVAWNESDEALAAIRKCLPILKAARQVDVVVVDPPTHSPERSDPGGAVTLFLARHGIKAEVSILARSMPKVADVLLRFARDNATDTIVMGGYGHSRLREAILGGTTRDMLEKVALPILMAR